MKNMNKILAGLLMLGMILISSGLIYASIYASSQPTAQQNSGSMVFSTIYGIKYNAIYGEFEIYNSAGFSWIDSDYWFNGEGEKNSGTVNGSTGKPIEGEVNRPEGENWGSAVAAQATGKAKYRIMNDIAYEYRADYFNPNYESTLATIATGGVVDGGGYTLSNFPVRQTNRLISPLFGENSGEIRNIIFRGTYKKIAATKYTGSDYGVYGGNYLGFLCAYNKNIVTLCKAFVSADVTEASAWTGGIVGRNNFQVLYCTAEVFLVGQRVGGIVGGNTVNSIYSYWAVISGCRSAGVLVVTGEMWWEVNGSGDSGLVGGGMAAVGFDAEQCESSMYVELFSSLRGYIGGIFGAVSTFDGCYSVCRIRGATFSGTLAMLVGGTGGIAGGLIGTVQDFFTDHEGNGVVVFSISGCSVGFRFIGELSKARSVIGDGIDWWGESDWVINGIFVDEELVDNNMELVRVSTEYTPKSVIITNVFLNGVLYPVYPI